MKNPVVWNHEVAQFLATNEQIGELKEQHWQVLEYVRDYNGRHEAWPLPQRIDKDLMVNVRRLFPGSPEVVFKVAGVAEPGDQIKWHAVGTQNN